MCWLTTRFWGIYPIFRHPLSWICLNMLLWRPLNPCVHHRSPLRVFFCCFFLAAGALSLLKRNGPVWGWIPHFQSCRERVRTFHRPHTSRIIKVPMDSQPWEVWTVFYQVPVSNHPNVLSNHASVGATWSSLSVKPFIFIWDQLIYFCKSSLRSSGKSPRLQNGSNKNHNSPNQSLSRTTSPKRVD